MRDSIIMGVLLALIAVPLVLELRWNYRRWVQAHKVASENPEPQQWP